MLGSIRIIIFTVNFGTFNYRMVCSRKDSRVLLDSELTVGAQVLPGE